MLSMGLLDCKALQDKYCVLELSAKLPIKVPEMNRIKGLKEV